MSRLSRDSEAEWIIVSLGAMAAGFALGLLYTSPKGREARVRMSEEASRGVKWLDRQLEEARARILAAGDEAADHLRTVVEETVEKVVPTFGSEDDWRSVYAETDEEVRRLKQ
ncbi:MAG: hypothetical protein WBW88_00130 [Rhodothermales bacterium]